MSGDLIDTTEMYLKTVFELSEVGVVPMRARIAERLGHSGPTVSQTVARMERDGLLHLTDERVIELTAAGREKATAVMRKHRLAERLLVDVIGLDVTLAHEEACRWEHVMSLEVERRLAGTLTGPWLDPYGNPIPGLATLGIEETAVTGEGQDSAKGLVALNALNLSSGPQRVRIVRIGEWAQADIELLADLAGHGVLPGAQATVRALGEELAVMVDGDEGIVLDHDTAGQIAVTPDAA